ncbi:MAG TPA: AMP-binding protein, partial [Deltaproteobacteria bacterium]|nr:AMP-binding protein [Deltaproteobacteria bacterium]
MGITPYEMNVLRRASIGDMLVRTAQRYPQKAAFIFRDQRIDFREFNARVNRCAHGLKKLGVEKGDRAAILSHNCDQFLTFWWALMKLGAIITPLNFMFKAEEIRYIITHSEPTVFFVEDSLVQGVLEIKESLTSVRHFGYINLSSKDKPEGWMNIEALWSRDHPEDEPEVEIDADDPATLLYTSGTESLPKGVLSSHLNFYIDVMCAVADLGVQRSDVVIAGIPFYHVAAMYLCVSFICIGATSVLEYAPNPREILELTAREKVTLWVWPPSLYAVLPHLPDFEKYDLSSLRTCIVFGALSAPEVLRQWERLLPDVGFMNYYGQTEMSPLGTSLPPEEFSLRPTSIGRAHTMLNLKVFDPNDRELPPGEVGELVARGPSIMLGYYKDEENTRKAFRSGWHHTGDLVRMDEDGFVYFVDRKKDIIKSGGENVSSREVEAVLYRYPGIADAAVIGLPDPYWSEAVTAV